MPQIHVKKKHRKVGKSYRHKKIVRLKKASRRKFKASRR